MTLAQDLGSRVWRYRGRCLEAMRPEPRREVVDVSSSRPQSNTPARRFGYIA
jgi:hypothetical protein